MKIQIKTSKTKDTTPSKDSNRALAAMTFFDIFGAFPTETPEAQRTNEISRKKLEILHRLPQWYLHVTVKAPIYVVELDLVNRRRHAEQSSIIPTNERLVRYKAALGRSTKKVVDKTRVQRIFPIDQLDSVEYQLWFISLLETADNVRQHYRVLCERLLSVRRRTAKRKTEHKEDIKAIIGCIKYSLGRRSYEPNRHCSRRIMSGFALVYGTRKVPSLWAHDAKPHYGSHRGFRDRASCRMLERDTMQLVRGPTYAPLPRTFAYSSALGETLQAFVAEERCREPDRLATWSCAEVDRRQKRMDWVDPVGLPHDEDGEQIMDCRESYGRKLVLHE